MLIGAIIGLILMAFVSVYEHHKWNIRHTSASVMLGACMYGGVGSLVGFLVERW